MIDVSTILVSSPIVEELELLIRKSGIDKEFRFKAEEELTKEDFMWADAYVNFRPTTQFEFGNLKWIHSLGAGVDSFLYERAWKEDVLLTRTICSFGERISEYCLFYILKDLQEDHYFQIAKMKKEWKPRTPKLIKDQNIIVFGTGEIGQELAKRLSRFGATVIGVSKSGKANIHFKNVVTVQNINETIKKADWVINTLPLTKETKHLFDHSIFNELNGASFINVGRGLSVDESALLLALDHGNVKHAILDVFQTEPLPLDSPLWDHQKITITPHISAVTTPEEAVACFLSTLSEVEKGNPLPNKVKVTTGY